MSWWLVALVMAPDWALYIAVKCWQVWLGVGATLAVQAIS